MLLGCHLAGHGEVFELLLLRLGVADDFLVPILLDTFEVVLDLLDVINDPTSTVISFF
jgi:hypothetical protein